MIGLELQVSAKCVEFVRKSSISLSPEGLTGLVVPGSLPFMQSASKLTE